MITAIFSDLHLGSKQSKRTTQDIINICRLFNIQQIYFIGDIVDCLIDEQKSREILITLKHSLINIPFEMINGNHDPIYGISVIERGIESFKVRMMHGHQFESKWSLFCDPYCVPLNEFFLRWTGINLQQILRDLTTKNYPEGAYPAKLYKQRQLVLGHNYGVDILITGHTHCPEASKIGEFWYCNPGDWNSFILIDSSGPKLHYFKDYL